MAERKIRAYICRELTGYQNLSFEELSLPSLGPSDVHIDVRATGINFADSLITEGKYQAKPELPFIPGSEIAGIVLEVGDRVRSCKVGQRVMASPKWGGYAEEAIADAAAILPMPESMSFEDGAAFRVTYDTSYIALVHRAHLKPGEVLVVHAAAGGVGLTAVQIGKKLGAIVIGTASSAEKLEIARQNGADHTINYVEEDLRSRIKELTDGRGADVIYDSVGGDTFVQSLRAINFEGRILIIGFAGGDIQQIPANHVMVKNVDIIGVNVGGYGQHRPEVRTEMVETLLRWYEEGAIKPYVSDVVPLTDALEGLRRVVTRQSTGKVVIQMDPSDIHS